MRKIRITLIDSSVSNKMAFITVTLNFSWFMLLFDSRGRKVSNNNFASSGAVSLNSKTKQL